MSANKKNIGLTNGWILCPSKSFPGKFYYFNVLNGETAWSLNEDDKKGLKQDSSIQKITDKAHNYPEPTHHPDDTSVLNKYNIGTNIQKLGINTQNSSYMFGQASFPKYIPNVEPLMPNIVWTPIQLPIFCSENKKLSMIDEVTQTSEVDRELFIQTCDIPLCKRFKSYENPTLCFDSKNKLVNKSVSNFATSTPRPSAKLDAKPNPQNPFTKSKSVVKEPILNIETKLPESKTPLLSVYNRNTTLQPSNNIELKKFSLHHSNKVESPKNKVEDIKNKVENTKSNEVEQKMLPKRGITDNLESTDLRFLLIARRRKSMDVTADSAVERKKLKPCEVRQPAPKKVTFDLSDSADEDAIMSQANTQEEFIPLTINNIKNINSPSTLPLRVSKELKPQTASTKNYSIPDLPKDSKLHLNEEQGFTRNRQHIWYIAVDTDVLLLDHVFIDQLVLSDKNCKLLIPHAVRMDIQALCMGDCRGQRRVITARQLTRLLAVPPQHYKVEPAPINNTVMTTESILNCCSQVHLNNYVVLITNDPHLQTNASSLNIPNYKLNEVKCGVNIKPDASVDFKENIINTSDDNDASQSQTNTLFNNVNNLDHIHTVKELKTKLNFLAKETDKIMLHMDKLYNITEPKSQKYKEITKYDSDSTTSDISREVKNLNLKDNDVFTPRNDNKNLFFPLINKTNLKEHGFINIEKKIHNPNAILNVEKAIPNLKRELLDFQKISKQKQQISFQNENLKGNENLFCSTPNVKPSQCQNKSYFENAKPVENSRTPGYLSLPNMCLPRHETERLSKEKRPVSATQSSIRKMLSPINLPAENQNQSVSSNDPTGIFKVPQQVQFKNRAKNSSKFIPGYATCEKLGTCEFKKIDSIEESQRRFCIKSKIISEKINARNDEWLCTFTQIMEDFLCNLLQKNCAYMKDTVAPLTLHDTLNCIKMLYDSHTKIREAVDNLSEMLYKSTTKRGKSKLFLQADDFMSLFGYGVFLIHTLKAILPESDELKDAERYLSLLLSNIESQSAELDPALLKTPNVSCGDIDGKDEARLNFVKERSYVIDYLKKHYKEWAEYNEDLENQDSNNKFLNPPGYKVLRTFGKNLNMLKIDSSKTISLSKMTENKSPVKLHDGSKVIRLRKDEPIVESTQANNVNVEIIAKRVAEPFKHTENEQNPVLSDILNENNLKIMQNYTIENEIKNSLVEFCEEKAKTKVIRPIKNTEIEAKNKTEVKGIRDLLIHRKMFTQIGENAAPKIVRNINLIDEYEKKSKSKEPLDLHLLDYSEIYDPSMKNSSENLQCDVDDKYGDLETSNYTKEISVNNANFELTDNVSPLEDFTEDAQMGNAESFIINYGSKNVMSISQICDSFTLPDNADNISLNLIKKSAEKLDYETERHKFNDNHAIHIESWDANDNCESYIDNNIATNDNFITNSQIMRDDSTNDSGFENDSTYAHSVVKIFLNELSTTYKVVYQFVNNFIMEIRGKELCDMRKNTFHIQASKSLEDLVAIIQRLRNIIARESAEETILKTLLLKAGVEATSDKRMTRYRQIVKKSLEQAQILENALKIIVLTTIGDFDSISTNAESLSSSIRYFNIFE